MPRLRMLDTRAGPVAPFVAGQEYDVAPEIGDPLVQDGAAEWVGVQAPARRPRRRVPDLEAAVSPPEMEAADG